MVPPRLFGLLLLGVGACAPVAPRCPEPAPPAMVPVEVASAALSPSPPSSPPAPAAPPEDLRCWGKGRPAARPRPRASEACAPLNGVELQRAENALRRAFVMPKKPSRLFLDFACSPVFGDPVEVVFEQGSGHGGSLDLVRFLPEEDQVLVRRIRIEQYRGRVVQVGSTTIESKKFARIIASARVMMLAKLNLVELETDGGLGISAWVSSADYHLRLTLKERDGDLADRGFTGYESSSSALDSLPVELATRPLQKLLEGATFREEEPSAEDRAWLTERFLFTMSGEPYWWVKERFVSLIKALGTVDAIPALVPLLSKKGDPSADRTRVAALEAIQALSGWDPTEGGSLGVEAAAEAAAKACR